MTAYYNEIDPYAAQWLRNLIEAGHIAPGYVDERSIEDVYPSDLRGFTQCHFFAGIGVWSHALRSAGWSDDRPVWTGSCPCQPFSAAGAGSGFDDQRHLWPAFFHLIQECSPATVFGEQVASKDANPWIDLVQTDLEAVGYGVGAIAFPSAGIGAPHIRDRLYWVGHASGARLEGHAGNGVAARREGSVGSTSAPSLFDWVANDNSDGRGALSGAGQLSQEHHAEPCVHPVGMADAEHDGCCGSKGNQAEPSGNQPSIWLPNRGYSAPEGQPPAGPTNGMWADADWLYCRDGKWRPVESGTFPLAHGAASGMGYDRTNWHSPAGKEKQGHRAGRLKGYGNAINAKAAQAFIECVMESL